jgi:hypothetical protein
MAASPSSGAPPAPPSRPTAAPALRRHVLQLVVAVLVLHGAMIALYYGLRIEARPPQQRTVFLVAWTALSLVVVLVYLARVRATRLRARRARAAGR